MITRTLAFGVKPAAVRRTRGAPTFRVLAMESLCWDPSHAMTPQPDAGVCERLPLLLPHPARTTQTGHFPPWLRPHVARRSWRERSSCRSNDHPLIDAEGSELVVIPQQEA